MFWVFFSFGRALPVNKCHFYRAGRMEKSGGGPVLAWRSGKSADLSCDRSRVRSRLRTSRFWSRVRVAFYKRMTGSLARTYTAYAATHGTPSGEVASRCNPRHKGACKPNSSKDSVSGAQIPASAMVCVGAARNLLDTSRRWR